MVRIRIAVLALVIAALSAAPAANAKIHVALGIGEQSPSDFTNKNFKALKIKKARYFIAWNAIHNKGLIAQTDAYVKAARSHGVRVLIHISTDNYAHRKAKLPTVSQYKHDVGRLIRRYKAKGVKEWGVWNEADHISEPTWKNPKRAAQYFLAMRSMCKGCTIVALDMLDQANAKSYVARWFKAIPKSKRRYAKVFGIHNYPDVNRFRAFGTRKLIADIRHFNKRAQFWLTETGGIVNLGKNFPCSTKRAAKATKYMFTLAKKYRKSIKRMYPYNFFGTNPSCGFFDAGLVTFDGKKRASYDIVKKYGKQYTR